MNVDMKAVIFDVYVYPGRFFRWDIAINSNPRKRINNVIWIFGTMVIGRLEIAESTPK